MVEFDHLRHVLDVLYSATPGRPIDRAMVQNELEGLNARFSADDGWKKAEQALPDFAVPVSEESLQSAICALNELRLRAIVTALSYQSFEGGEQREAPVIDELVQEVGPIVHCPGGVTYSNIQGIKVILLPLVEMEEQAHGVYTDFLHIEEQASPSASWVIDCSLVETFPTLLLANVVAYTGRLRKMNRDLLLHWVHPESLSPPQLQRMIDFFRLERRGAHLFSRKT